MTDEEKSQIRMLRSEGYSYGSIAKILNLKRDTVSSFCRRNQIKASDSKEDDSKKQLVYRRCPFCHQLFLANSLKNQLFCTTYCRRHYWDREEQEMKAIEDQSLYIETLRKELDFLPEKSDELVGEEATHLCRKKEPTINS